MRRIRNVLLCVVLFMAAFHGQKMRPDEVEELMRAMSQPKIAHTLRMEEGDDDPFKRMMAAARERE